MSRILLLFAHAKHLDGITFHDLYEAYPDFDIDIKFEQQLLLQHDIIIWQPPFYWYSAPAISGGGGLQADAVTDAFDGEKGWDDDSLMTEVRGYQ